MTRKFQNNTLPVFEHKVYYVYSRVEPDSGASLKPSLPIVFLHGAIVSHIYWMPTVRLMAENYDVYALDFPGHGRSSKPRDAVPVIRQAEVTAEWINLMGLEKVIIAANSYACEIAVELALRFPKKIDCLVLTAPASDPSEPSIRQQGLRLIRDAVFENPLMGFVLLLDSFQIGIRRGVQTCQNMIAYDYISRLPLLTHDTLVVRGTKDTVATQPWVERVAKLIPKSELVIIEGGPHDVNFSSPKELAAVTNNFLQKRVRHSEQAP